MLNTTHWWFELKVLFTSANKVMFSQFRRKSSDKNKKRKMKVAKILEICFYLDINEGQRLRTPTHWKCSSQPEAQIYRLLQFVFKHHSVNKINRKFADHNSLMVWAKNGVSKLLKTRYCFQAILFNPDVYTDVSIIKGITKFYSCFLNFKVFFQCN